MLPVIQKVKFLFIVIQQRVCAVKHNAQTNPEMSESINSFIVWEGCRPLSDVVLMVIDAIDGVADRTKIAGYA